MDEQEPKGFKVIDRRGAPDEERAKPPEPPPAAPVTPPTPPPAGNREGGAGVHREAGPEPAGVAGPTFLDLVMTLQMGAMVNLGMVQSPDGRRSPVNLPAAKDSIDLLEILHGKTKGNLTEQETGVLSEGLYHLRMAYIAAANAAAPGGGGKSR